MMDFEEEEFKIPAWWECSWRRIGCGKKSCPMCGPLREFELKAKRDELFGTRKEKVDIGAALVLDNTPLENMDEFMDTDDPTPEPEEFPLYRKVHSWRDKLVELARKTEKDDPLTLGSEAWEDLMWYGTLIQGKVYRQLCNRYELDQEGSTRDVDYEYTGYVLRESLRIIESSIATIQPIISNQRELAVLRLSLQQLKQDILAI